MKKNSTNLALFTLVVVVFIVSLVFVYEDQQNLQSESNYKAKEKIFTSRTFDEIPNYNLTKPQDLFKKADLVVEATYMKDLETTIQASDLYPVRFANIQVVKVLKGDAPKNAIMNIAFHGGNITLDQYVSILSSKELEKIGYNELSDQEKKSFILRSRDKQGVLPDPQIGKTYLIFLVNNGNKNYVQVLSDGYGMREVDTNGQVYNLKTKAYESLNLYE